MIRSRDAAARFGSVIIHHFAIKSSFFMSLGACRLKRRILVLVVGLCASLSFMSCGSSETEGSTQRLARIVFWRRRGSRRLQILAAW